VGCGCAKQEIRRRIWKFRVSFCKKKKQHKTTFLVYTFLAALTLLEEGLEDLLRPEGFFWHAFY